MVFDLRRALLKEEVESARLMDFEFRLRARTWRKVAAELDVEPAEMVAKIAGGDDEAILASLEGQLDREIYMRCREAARAELIAERGDPTPHKLA